jgi:hypothetical protein
MMPIATSVSRLSSTTFELMLQGRMEHPHWVAMLFRGLAELRISVVSGRAIETAMQQWEAKFTLDFTSSQVVPEEFDFAALARREGPTSLDPHIPRLSNYSIMRREGKGLEVLLQGPDQVGFLGRLLSRLAMLMLFPTELEINTENARINDRLVFGDISADAFESTQKALDTMLSSFVEA